MHFEQKAEALSNILIYRILKQLRASCDSFSLHVLLPLGMRFASASVAGEEVSQKENR